MNEFSQILTGAGPYMGAAAFMAMIQLAVIAKISNRIARTSLLCASVAFQMLVLGIGIFNGG